VVAGHVLLGTRGTVTPVAPVVGVGLAALLARGLRWWPAVLAGTLLGEAVVGALSWADLWFAVADTVVVVAAVPVVHRVAGRRGLPDLTRSRHVAAVLAGACAGTLAGLPVAIPGAAVADVGSPTLTWAVGAVVGAVVVGPVLVALREGWARPRGWVAAEALVLATAALVVSLVCVYQNLPEYLAAPLVLVAAVRFGPVGATVGTAVASAPFLWAAVPGRTMVGPVAHLSGPGQLVYTGLFVVLTVTGALLLQAVYRERSLSVSHLASHAEALRVANEGLSEANADLEGRTAQLERSHARLALSEERYRLAFEHAPMGVLLTTLEGECLRANAAFGEIVGREPADLVGLPVERLCHPEDRPVAAAARAEMRGDPREPKSGELRFLRPDGTVVWGKVNGAVEHGTDDQPWHLVYLVEDVSERKQAEVRLAHMAFHDPLTELPNRALLRDRLEMALRKLSRKPGLLAVLFSDLDRFKVINDSLGHDVGDRLLVAVASRMRATLRPGDTVARFGGDEFVVLAEGLPDEAAVAELADRLHTALRTPFEVGDRRLTVAASIGVALGTSPEQRPEDLIQDADAAMYLAKATGTGRTAFFGDEMRSRVTRRFDLEDALRHALEVGGLELHYQPLVALADGRVAGLEALLRWQDERWRHLPVPEVIAVAEETGLIVPMGSWVVSEACRQLVRWDAQKPGRRIASVAVNLSPSQVAGPDLVDVVRDVLAETGVEPHRLCVEITETAVVSDVDAAVTTLEGLSRLGVRIALDDFGTGYSSLSYVKRLPIDVLKIDRSFVASLGTDNADAAIVDAVVVMARRLGITTVGEGVESEEQLRALAHTGSDHAQGYHLSRPVAAHRVIDLVSRLERRSEVLLGGPPGDWRPRG
jgi:diguanylate cyclase (GGDEF)-like protein/PAS domain S-box-containing protein